MEVLRRAVEPMLKVQLAHAVRASRALLKEKHRSLSLRRSTARPREFGTYFEERPEFPIIFHIILQPLFRCFQLTNVRGVSRSELGGRTEEDIPNSGDDLALFPLSNAHCLEEAMVAFTQIEDIPKYFIDKFIDAASDGGRIRVPQRSNESLVGTRERTIQRSPGTFCGPRCTSSMKSRSLIYCCSSSMALRISLDI